MITLSVAVMAYPGRLREVKEDLLPKIDQKLLQDFQIFWDVDKKGNWWNAKRCWQAASTASHHMVICDDAVPCNHFIPAVLKALEANPTPPISWYVYSKEKQLRMQKKMLEAQQRSMSEVLKRGQHWLISRHSSFAVCASMPTPMTRAYLAWELRHIEQDQKKASLLKRWDDMRLCAFLEVNKIDCWLPVPSLVQHGQGKSLLTGRKNMYLTDLIASTTDDPSQWDWTIPADPVVSVYDRTAAIQPYIK